MEKIDQLIHGKWIVTCELQNRVLENHALAIKDGEILAILPSLEADRLYHPQTKEHYQKHALLPGFINCHTHLAMNIFRGLADDLMLMDWLNNYIWPAERKWVGEELVYDASLLAMGEMLRSGTTCFNDMYFFPAETAKAAEKAGLRGHIGMTVISLPTAWASTTEEYFEKGLQFLAAYRKHPLITPTLAPHSTYTTSREDLCKAQEIAEQHQLKMNIHLHEAYSEIQLSLRKHNKRPLAFLHELNMVSDNLIAVHMTQLDKKDFNILREHKPNIVHCPESNMKLASGTCPVHLLNQFGLNVALGTDGAASNNDLDMIGEMRTAALLGKIAAEDSTAVSAEKVLQMATIQGAIALGIDRQTGSLTLGKAADFIAIDLEQIETQPLYHPVSQIVYAASRQQVTDVWVNGKQLLKNRQLVTLDETELLKKAHFWRKKIQGSL